MRGSVQEVFDHAEVLFLRFDVRIELPISIFRDLTPKAFALAKEQYAEWGVDIEAALRRLETIAISLHCWQGDDVGGFENTGQELGGGLVGADVVEYNPDRDLGGMTANVAEKIVREIAGRMMAEAG